MWQALLWLLLLAVSPVWAWAAPAPGVLPVYIEENHAGSFNWIAQNISLDEPHTLVLIDAHSDATAAAHSDAIREGLRRVVSIDERKERIGQWRRRGRIQAFNWIEPLMPRPIEQVVWLPRWTLSVEEREKFAHEAGESIDGRTEFEARAAGDLAAHWQVLGGDEFGQWDPGELPLVASVDLDFFAGMPVAEAGERLRRIWSRLLELPRLRGITFAISRPWMADDAEAFRLLYVALEEIRLVPGARVSFEPFMPPGPDASLRAREFPDGKSPALKIEQAPPPLAAHFALYGKRYAVEIEPEKWRQLVDEWERSFKRWTIRPDAGEPSADGVFRLGEKEAPALRVSGGTAGPGRVRWFARQPAAVCYNLLPDVDLGKGFTRGAGPWVRDRRSFLKETEDGALAAETWRHLLDPVTGWGRVKIEAEVETSQGWEPAPVVELRVIAGDGFRAGLSEQFGLPYVFGASFYGEGDSDGADTGIGNDCANFLIHAWRRTGRGLSWGNPAQLRKRLRPLASDVGVQDKVPFSADDFRNGLVIDFGNHVAALWEDREPVGVLDPQDIVVHHLSGVPERTTLLELSKSRPHFAVRTLPSEPVCRIALVGDVVLSDVDKPALQRLGEQVRGVDISIANLEGVAADSAERASVRYNFAFPPERLGWLKDAGITAVGMANNHAGDAGRHAIQEVRSAGEQFGLPIFGVGADAAEAARPWRIEKNGLHFAFFAVSCVESRAAELDQPGVLALPEHAGMLERALRQSREDGEIAIVLVHWGQEYTAKVDPDQRSWACWLIERGAHVVVGAHPHVVQPLDAWRGKPIAYSLGNAVFPRALQGADSGTVLEVGFNSSGEIVSLKQTAIRQ